jgi:hypothetical protein
LHEIAVRSALEIAHKTALETDELCLKRRVRALHALARRTARRLWRVLRTHHDKLLPAPV